MHAPQTLMHAEHSRRDAQQARAWGVSVAVSFAGAVCVLGTLVTAKINPRGVSGGLPKELKP